MAKEIKNKFVADVVKQHRIGKMQLTANMFAALEIIEQLQTKLENTKVAAEKVCKVYFEMLEEFINEDEIRKRVAERR